MLLFFSESYSSQLSDMAGLGGGGGDGDGSQQQTQQPPPPMGPGGGGGGGNGGGSGQSYPGYQDPSDQDYHSLDAHSHPSPYMVESSPEFYAAPPPPPLHYVKSYPRGEFFFIHIP